MVMSKGKDEGKSKQLRRRVEARPKQILLLLIKKKKEKMKEKKKG